MEQCTKNLIQKQNEEFPNIIEDLQINGRKTRHWAWYVWPTERAGRSEPYPKSSISPQDVEVFLSKTNIEQWTVILLSLTELLNKASSRSEVIPPIDHGRIQFFFRFWQQNASFLEDYTAFRDAVAHFEAAFKS